MIKRVIDTAFWTDDKVLDMFSVEDKLFMLYLLTNPHSTQLGIYKINEKIAAFELGYSVEVIHVLIERFEKKYNIILYNKDTKEIAIINYLKYSILKGGTPVECLLQREINMVKDKSLIKVVFDKLSDYKNLNETVKKIIKQNIQNVNVNDNDVSYHDSYHDSSSEPIIQEVKQPNKTEEAGTYGEYKNVKLTQKQFEDINNKGFDYLVERLSSYMKSKGKEYADHHATIMLWSKKEVKNIAASQGSTSELDTKKFRRADDKYL
ncbi:MAG: hypothetical protein CVU94_02000 [Firmicutes bacterium HGW-Firmicutes-19]|nr:MAG: hypothetical protein CVU94_02000 [Firmicutes bacterium HGW-Firmicutes-19]